MDERLSQVFLGALATEPLQPVLDDLDRQLRVYVLSACSTWPEINVTPVDLVRYIAARSLRGVLPPLDHAGDLLLACGCIQGLPSAFKAFHTCYDVTISRVLSHRRMALADADDVTQIVYEVLLLHRAGAEPKLASYRALGPLRSWVATAAATTAANLRRAETRRRVRERGDPATAGAVLAVIDPERSYFKMVYRHEVERAVEAALAGLDDRASVLLRLHFGERLSIDQLSLMYRVNRATTARWVVAARETLARRVRADLRHRLNLSESDCDSVVGLTRSELGDSLLKLFDRPAPEGPSTCLPDRWAPPEAALLGPGKLG